MYRQIAKVQKEGGIAALLDGEYAYDPDWGRQFGINNKELILGHFSTAEEHYEQIFKLLREINPDLIVTDSVASLVPEKYASLHADTAKIAWETAKINKKYLRLLFAGVEGVKLPETKTALVFINHLSDKIGEIYGDAYDTGGGKAVKFWSHLRIRLMPAGFGKKRDKMGNPIEQIVLMKTMKSRLAMPHRQVKIILDWKGGLQAIPVEVVYIVALEKGIISQSGAWISFEWNGQQYKLQGKEKFVRFCDEHEDFKNYVMETENVSDNKKSMSDDLVGGIDV